MKMKKYLLIVGMMILATSGFAAEDGLDAAIQSFDNIYTEQNDAYTAFKEKATTYAQELAKTQASIITERFKRDIAKAAQTGIYPNNGTYQYEMGNIANKFKQLNDDVANAIKQFTDNKPSGVTMNELNNKISAHYDELLKEFDNQFWAEDPTSQNELKAMAEQYKNSLQENIDTNIVKMGKVTDKKIELLNTIAKQNDEKAYPTLQDISNYYADAASGDKPNTQDKIIADGIIKYQADNAHPNNAPVTVDNFNTTLGAVMKVQKIEDNKQNIRILEHRFDIATNKADIATNKADIATNKADIATNKENITLNTARINAIVNNGDSARISRLEEKTNQLEKKMDRGLSQVAAMTAIDFQVLEVGEFGVGAAVGSHASTQSIAIGAGYRPNDALTVNAKFAATPNQKLKKSTIGVGAVYKFKVN